MKKILLPVALFAAFALSACGDEPLDESCEQAEQGAVKKEVCDLSVAEACYDEDGTPYFSYKGEKYYNATDLGVAVCGEGVAVADMEIIKKQLNAQMKRLIDRIRVNAIRAI